MKKKDKLFDINDELLISQFQGGIKLIKPTHLSNFYDSSHLACAMKLPFAIYFLDIDGKGRTCNEAALIQCNIQSKKDAIGESIAKFADDASATQAILNTQTVLRERETKFFDEGITYKNSLPIQTFAIKIPWYSAENQLIGVVGISINTQTQPIAAILSQINQLNLINLSEKTTSSPLSLSDTCIQLSKREKDCLHLYIQGYTAKTCAKMLNLSYRTVENYLQNIKTKMDVSTKSELILKTIDYFHSPKSL